MSEENKAIVRRIIEEAWNKRNMAAVDELVTTNYVGHFAILPEPLHGIEALKQFMSHYFTAFPDVQVTVEEMVAEGDKVVAHWSAHGTHKGDLMGIAPTGKQVAVTGMWIHRIAGGKLAEQWGIHDALGMLQQLGVVPAPA